MNISTVNELIQSLESARELSIKERKYLELAKAYQQLAAENVALKNAIECHKAGFTICEACGEENGSWNDDVCKALDDIPTTDRILAAAEARGVEKFAAQLPGNDHATVPGKWIPVSERLPAVGHKVLAYRPDAPESDDPLIRVATYVGKSAHGHGFDCYCKPTHWMPLPASPQELK